MSDKLSMVMTSGGRGSRLRPVSLYSPTTMIPKGLMRIMGIPLTEIQLKIAESLKIKNVYIIAQHLENREQLANRFGNGRLFGFKLHYSHPIHDHKNNGSGDAILRNMQEYNLEGSSIILPNDTLFDCDFKAALKQHKKSGAIVTVLTIPMKPGDTINTYGLIDVSGNFVKKIVEKPKNEKEIMSAMGYFKKSDLNKKKVHVNTAGYIVNNDKLRELISEEWIIEGRISEFGFDMAGNLLAGLIDSGEKICVFPISSWGDFGSAELYLETMNRVLSGEFLFLNKFLKKDGYVFMENNVCVHSDLFGKGGSKKKIKAHLKKKKIKLGPNVFVGRDCDLREKCSLSYCDIEKQVSVGVGAKVRGSFVSPYSWIGYGAEIFDSVLSLQASVESSLTNKSKIFNGSVVGPQLILPEGSILEKSEIYPGCFFKKAVKLKSKVVRPEREDLIKFYKAFR